MKIPNLFLFLMIAMLIGSIKLPSSDDKFHSEDTILNSLCSGERCTEPITDLRIGNFSFEAQNCVQAWAGFRDGCVLVFGNEGRRQKEELGGLASGAYRIVNGPVPFSLEGYDGQCVGFADVSISTGSDFAGGHDKLSRQVGERIYALRRADETFPFFDSREKSIGVLMDYWAPSGARGHVELFVFSTESNKNAFFKGFCGDPQGGEFGPLSLWEREKKNTTTTITTEPNLENIEDLVTEEIRTMIAGNPYAKEPAWYVCAHKGVSVAADELIAAVKIDCSQ